MSRSGRLSIVAVSLTCLFASALASQAVAKPGSASDDGGWRGFAVDPRSGGAINRDAAGEAAPAGDALFRGNRLINPTAVNNPAADATAQDTQSETTVAALGTNVAVGWNDSGSCTPGCGTSSNHFTGWGNSTNSGATFTDRGRLPASAEGDAGDPVLAGIAPNTMYLATLGFDTGENIQVFKSTNGAASFGAPVNGTPGFAGSGDFQDKEWIAVDTKSGTGFRNVYLCWTRFFGATGAQILFTRSTNQGASFGPSGGTLISNGGQGCYVAVGPDHSVYVFYYRGTGAGGQGGDNKLFMRRSTNQGVTFGPEVQVADLQTTTVNGGLNLNGGLRSNSFPHAAVNPVSGDIIVVFNDDTVAGNADNGNVFYTRSLNNGATWSPPVRFNGDLGRDQFFPTVAISPTGGEVMLGYYSRSHDPSNLMFHRRIRPALMNTTTGAITLRPSAQLSPDTPIVIAQDPVINPTYMGDYDQIAANASTFFSVWSDNRDGNSFHNRQPDVFMARVARNAPNTTTNMGVTVTAVPGTVDEGDTTTLQIRATATGHSARDVYINMAPTAGLSFQSVSGGSSCELINGFVNCSLGTIAAGATVQRNVTAVATTAGTRTATARVTTTDNDTVAGNNVGSDTVTVNSVPKVTQTFSTGNIAVPIPDASSVDVPINVGVAGTILDLNAQVRINHTWSGDLDMFLESPGGDVVELSTDNHEGGGDNFGSGANNCTGTPTTFDDSAASSITTVLPPFAGTFKPEGSLAAFAGSPQNGTWELHITDDFGADVGTVGCVRLVIRRPA